MFYIWYISDVLYAKPLQIRHELCHSCIISNLHVVSVTHLQKHYRDAHPDCDRYNAAQEDVDKLLRANPMYRPNMVLSEKEHIRAVYIAKDTKRNNDRAKYRVPILAKRGTGSKTFRVLIVHVDPMCVAIFLFCHTRVY